MASRAKAVTLAALPKHLERVPELNQVPHPMRIGPLCGAEMTNLGHLSCEILDVRPAELYVRQRFDDRVACPNDDTILTAPTPPVIVERSKLPLANSSPNGRERFADLANDRVPVGASDGERAEVVSVDRDAADPGEEGSPPASAWLCLRARSGRFARDDVLLGDARSRLS